MDIFAVTILISLVVYVLVGNYAGRRVKDVDDYYVAVRRALMKDYKRGSRALLPLSHGHLPKQQRSGSQNGQERASKTMSPESSQLAQGTRVKHILKVAMFFHQPLFMGIAHDQFQFFTIGLDTIAPVILAH